MLVPFTIIASMTIILIVIWVQYMDNLPKNFDEDYCKYNHYRIYQVDEINYGSYYVVEVMKYKLLGIFPVWQMIYDQVDRQTGYRIIKRFSTIENAKKCGDSFYAKYLATMPDKVVSKKTLVDKK